MCYEKEDISSNFGFSQAAASVNYKQQHIIELLKAEARQLKFSLQSQCCGTDPLTKLAQGVGSLGQMFLLNPCKKPKLYEAVPRNSFYLEMLWAEQKLVLGVALHIKQWNRRIMSQSRK